MRLPPSKGWPSPRWWAGALAGAAACMAVTVYAGTRFDIRIDPQHHRCLPDARMFIVDRFDDRVGTGDLVAFEAPDLRPWIEPGTAMVKRVAAEGGMTVVVGRDATRVGGRVVATGLDAATALETEPSRFVRKERVPVDHLWVVAPGQRSLDSRYWGPIDRHRVIGTAYIVF